MFLVGLPVVLVIAYILYDMHKQLQKYKQEKEGFFGLASKYRAYDKCKAVIESMNMETGQYNVATNMVDQFNELYNNDDKSDEHINLMVDNLDDMIQWKINQWP